jgi:hypothetical protein
MPYQFSDSEKIAIYAGDLSELLKATGDDSVASFLARSPGVSLVEVARHYPGSGLCAAGICRAMMREAVERNNVREVAIDYLCREINENLPEGWGRGELLELRTAGPLVSLIAALTLDAQLPQFEANAKRVWGELKSICPPVGWRPLSADDPILREAFVRGWPPHGEHSSPRSG